LNKLNDLRKLENLGKEIHYFEKMLKENDSSAHLKKYYKEILQEINEEVRSLKKTLNVSVVENKITTYNGLNELFEAFPENRRRKVNKIMQRGDYFNLVYNLKEERMSIQKKNEIVYSAIPYDTGRNYIQRAAILTLLYPDSTKEYLIRHKTNLIKYIKQSLWESKKSSSLQVKKTSDLAEKYYNEIFEQPIFMMQVLGRMLQHDETGPLSANLAGKFLYDINLNTGITGYLVEFLKFVIETTRELPVATDGERVTLIENFKNNELTNSIYGQVYLSSYSNLDLKLLPERTQIEINKELMTIDNYVQDTTAPMLRSQVGTALQKVRKNYIAHSIHPSILEPMFNNVLPTHNNNLINVVSDIHSRDSSLPFQNNNFNILAGDISDSNAKDDNIKGLIVIGNHELSDIVKLNNNDDFNRFKISFQEKIFQAGKGGDFKKIEKFFESHASEINEFLYDKQLNDFDDFRELFWFKLLLLYPDASWPYIPVGDNPFYEVVKNKLANHFPKMSILNNEDLYYKGIRYVGLTVPVALVKRKTEAQKFMCSALKKVFDQDSTTPTVIVSHAPLFNELSMLSPKSKSYNSDNKCSLEELQNIFEKNNIIGVIHGHHHIPASKGREKIVDFAGKKLFVVCSIYSKINTGLELKNLINRNKKENQVKHFESNKKALVVKKEVNIYDYNTPIEEIPNLYREMKGEKLKFTVEKTIKGKRYRKRFDKINLAIDYLNELNQSTSIK
jgi:hypothetical protein